MQQAAQQANLASIGDLFALLTGGAAMLSASFQQVHRARDRKALGELANEQLEDAGIDPSAVHPTRPAVEVRAGLMAELMSLR